MKYFPTRENFDFYFYDFETISRHLDDLRDTQRLGKFNALRTTVDL